MSHGQTQYQLGGEIHPTFSERKYGVTSKRHGSPGGKGRRQLAVRMVELGTKMISTTANSLLYQNKRSQESGRGKCGIYLVELCCIHYLLESKKSVSVKSAR